MSRWFTTVEGCRSITQTAPNFVATSQTFLWWFWLPSDNRNHICFYSVFTLSLSVATTRVEIPQLVLLFHDITFQCLVIAMNSVRRSRLTIICKWPPRTKLVSSRRFTFGRHNEESRLWTLWWLVPTFPNFVLCGLSWQRRRIRMLCFEASAYHTLILT